MGVQGVRISSCRDKYVISVLVWQLNNIHDFIQGQWRNRKENQMYRFVRSSVKSKIFFC